MKAKKAILDIIKPLYLDSDGVDHFLARNSACIDELVGLPEAYASSFRLIAENFLDTLTQHEDNEFMLNILLTSMIIREQKIDVLDIASRALMLESAEDKVFYTECLINIDIDEVSSLLIHALPTLESYDEDSGYAQEKIIDFLTSKEDLSGSVAVIGCVNDISARVRASALLYIRKMDVVDAADELMVLLDEEDWEYNILIILELLRKWNMKKYLPQLIEISESDYILEDDTVLPAFIETIKHLKE